MNTNTKTAVVWGQTTCSACKTAKKLLEENNYTVDYREIDNGPWTKKDLFDILPDVRSVPQIFVNEQHVGGLGGLELYLMQRR